MSRVHIISDLHLEMPHAPQDHVEPDCDFTVIAGDLHNQVSGLAWISNTFKKDVVYIAGNHEFYGNNFTMKDTYNKLISNNYNIHFLQDSVTIIGDVRIIGSTLWTDYAIDGNQPLGMMISKSFMNDYQLISYDKPFVDVTPYDLLQDHKASIEFIKQELSKPFNGKTIVLTHHLPSHLSIAPQFKMSNSNVAFASSLENIILTYEPTLWIHGHTHNSLDYVLGNTRVVCNPRGYITSYVKGNYIFENPQWNKDLVIDI